MAKGYAVVATDAGHTGGLFDPTFGLDSQARVDAAYNAHDQTAQAAKSLLVSKTGKAPQRSYFVGCSGGGRQGMMFMQRFPTYFDGVVISDPAMSASSRANISSLSMNKLFTSIAPVDSAGKPLLSGAFNNSELTLAANSILAKCPRG